MHDTIHYKFQFHNPPQTIQLFYQAAVLFTWLCSAGCNLQIGSELGTVLYCTDLYTVQCKVLGVPAELGPVFPIHFRTSHTCTLDPAQTHGFRGNTSSILSYLICLQKCVPFMWNFLLTHPWLWGKLWKSRGGNYF